MSGTVEATIVPARGWDLATPSSRARSAASVDHHILIDKTGRLVWPTGPLALLQHANADQTRHGRSLNHKAFCCGRNILAAATLRCCSCWRRRARGFCRLAAAENKRLRHSSNCLEERR